MTLTVYERSGRHYASRYTGGEVQFPTDVRVIFSVEDDAPGELNKKARVEARQRKIGFVRNLDDEE